DGTTLDVYDTDVGRIGAVICWENYMPMLRMAMYSKGIQICCSPTADSRETWLPTVRHISLEGRCFVLSTCQVLRGADFPPALPNRLGDTRTAFSCGAAPVSSAPWESCSPGRSGTRRLSYAPI